MSDDAHTGDTVASRRRHRVDDTVVAERRRRGVPLRDNEPVAPVGDPTPRGAAAARQAYEPDPRALRTPAPRRVAQPVTVPHRAPPPAAGAGTVHDSADRAGVERDVRRRARRRLTWLLVAGAATAATAATLLAFLP